MIDGVMHLVGAFVVANDFHELLRRWRELIAKASGITPGHHGGT